MAYVRARLIGPGAWPRCAEELARACGARRVCLLNNAKLTSDRLLYQYNVTCILYLLFSGLSIFIFNRTYCILILDPIINIINDRCKLYKLFLQFTSHSQLDQMRTAHA